VPESEPQVKLSDLSAKHAHLFEDLATLPPESPAWQTLRDELVTLHLPLVHYLARRFAGRNEPMPDLVQVGTIGLIKAVDRFDASRGLAFSTFATPTILGEIKRYFRDSGWLIHVPRRAQELQTSLTAARAALSQELQRSPTVAEVADRLQISPDEVVDALEAGRAYSGLSLDSITEAGTGRPDHPVLSQTDEDLDRAELRAVLVPALEQLSERDRTIVALRFFDGKSQTDIAAIVGLSQMQVSRILARSLTVLRSRLQADPEDQ
jgi:RNA polymerase sigma-B factor